MHREKDRSLPVPKSNLPAKVSLLSCHLSSTELVWDENLPQYPNASGLLYRHGSKKHQDPEIVNIGPVDCSAVRQFESLDHCGLCWHV